MFRIRINDNYRIAVYDTGFSSSQTILMLHGWMLSEKIFEYQKNLLTNLCYRVVTLDFCGFGQSDAPNCRYSYNQFADEVYAVIRRLTLRNITLCGFDMGGAVAIRYMTRHNGYSVNKLALFAATAPSYVPRDEFPFGVNVSFLDSMTSLANTDRAKLCHNYCNCLFYREHSDAIKNWFEQIALDSSGIGTIRSAGALRNEDLREECGKIKVQTGIFHGQNDKLVPYSLSKTLRRAIPQSILYTFRNCGHGLFYDAMNDFNSKLLEFINNE